MRLMDWWEQRRERKHAERQERLRREEEFIAGLPEPKCGNKISHYGMIEDKDLGRCIRCAAIEQKQHEQAKKDQELRTLAKYIAEELKK